VLAEIPPSLNGTSPLVELPRIAGFSLIVLHASYGFGGLVGRIAGNRWVILTGMLSYGLYLYHPIVHVFCQQGLEALGVASGPGEILDPVLALILSFVVSWISFRFIEKPINDLKRHFPYVDAKAAVSAPAVAKDYCPQLDGLRGLAILMVFFHHSGVKLPHSLDWGQMGVRLFFVLSGFLITLSLWKIEDRSAQLRIGYAGELAVFHLRRFARLLPAFLAALAFGCLVGMQDVIEPLLWHLTFLTNFKIAMQGWFFGPTAHFWSLALQEQFYLLWPFFLLAVPRRIFPWVALGLIGVGYGYRVFCMVAGISDYWRWLMVPGSIDTFAIGGLLAWALRGPGLPPLPSRPLSIAGVVLLAAGCWAANRVLRYTSMGPWMDGLPEVFEGIVAAILVWGCVQGFRGPLGKFFEASPLRFIGRISYGIFIYHLVLFYFMEGLLEDWGIGPTKAPVEWSVLMFVMTFLVAMASWRWIEKPVVGWAKRFIESLAGRKVA
jgi:peptidoglycan/LPS O-acetylase OafA/YrhL